MQEQRFVEIIYLWAAAVTPKLHTKWEKIKVLLLLSVKENPVLNKNIVVNIFPFSVEKLGNTQ